MIATHSESGITPNIPSDIVRKGKRNASDNPPNDNDSDIENCVICLEKITEKCVAVPCRHSYDYVCIVNWLELRQACPLCNATVSELNLHTEFGKIRRELVEPPTPTTRSETPVTASSSYAGHNNLVLRYRRCANHRRRRPREPSPVSEDTALLRRRYIYKHRLRSLYVGSNRLSRFSNLNPKRFREDEELVSRARMWIRRELRVWEWTVSNAEFLIEFIIGILRSVDLKGSAGQAEEMIAEFLGREDAQIFIHELYNFLRSPFTELRFFDNFVQYEESIPRNLHPNR